MAPTLATTGAQIALGFHSLVMPTKSRCCVIGVKVSCLVIHSHNHPGRPSNTFDCKDDGAAKKEASGTFADMSRDISKRLQLDDFGWQIEVGTKPGNQFLKSRSRRNRSKAAAGRRGNINRGGDGRMYPAPCRIGPRRNPGPDFFEIWTSAQYAH
jgi:hypothetical protein